ncbi:GNAT family N-acetyltransferase [Streptomyces sp. NPDC007920]|uniref:GNAT family N-acetyltransferase n=1 Tax=Streptomyces sp. NPDC007920 TaxID=3364794 RepID=UPI0036ECF5B1
MNATPTKPQITVRDMTEQDIEDVSALRVRGWQHAYAGLMPQTYLDGLSIAEDAARRRAYFADVSSGMTNLVAQTADGTVGWASFGPARGEDIPQDDGELYAIYARPDLIGTGIGRALLKEVLHRASYPGLRLWVLEGNVRARRFYERAGFSPDGAVCADEVAGVPVPEVRYYRPRG